jgi:transglutaminase-like putative cysteine protease
MAVVAAIATLLAALPLITVFASLTWLFYTAVAIAVVVGAAMLVRTARGPVWAQVLAMMGALLLYLTFAFPSGQEFAGLIPTMATFQHFNDLLGTAGQLIRDEAVPVPDSDGLLLLTTAGVGLVAVLVDLAAVGLRRPALAGLPMLAIYSVPVAVLPEGLSVLPFGFAAAGFLWLLVADSVDRVRRFGRRFTGEGRDVDLWEPSPLSSAGRRLGVVGVVIAMVLPLAVPGMTSGLLDRFGAGFGPGDGSGGGTGIQGPTVNLSALLKDNLHRDSTFDMVHVKTTDPFPFYLRFGVADQITKDGFVNRAPSSGVAVNRGLEDVYVPQVAGVNAQRYRAEVQIVNFDMNLVPIYQRLASAEGLDPYWLYDNSTEQVFARRGGASINSRSYSFEYVRLSYTPAALRTAGPIPQTDAGSRELISVPVIPAVSEILDKLIADKVTEYDRVRAIYDHFSSNNGFQYTLQTEGGTSGTAIVDFLTNKKGFCVQYAAAMAWLVRSAGYPARVAFGFTRGAGGIQGVYALTNLNLHAWTEVFFPNFGWVPFDPTPVGSVAGSVQSSWAPDANNPDVGDGGPTDVKESPQPSGGVFPTGGPTDDNTNVTSGPSAQPVNTWVLAGAALVVLALFVLFAPAWRRRILRRRRRATGGPLIVIDRGIDAGPVPDVVVEPNAIAAARRDAHEAWAELLDTMVDFDVPVDEAETPRATATRLGALPALPPDAPGYADLLARAEERARYARTPLRSDGLDNAVRGTRAALAQRATRRQRIMAVVLPKSVLLRWRLAWVSWLNSGIRNAGRLREALAAVSPRRLLTRTAR